LRVLDDDADDDGILPSGLSLPSTASFPSLPWAEITAGSVVDTAASRRIDKDRTLMVLIENDGNGQNEWAMTLQDIALAIGFSLEVGFWI
jgi:hypothetical protein